MGEKNTKSKLFSASIRNLEWDTVMSTTHTVIDLHQQAPAKHPADQLLVTDHQYQGPRTAIITQTAKRK